MSPNYLLTNNTQTYSLAAKLKVCWEQLENTIVEDEIAMQEDISAAVGAQPRRQP